MKDDVIARLVAANPVPHDGPLNLPEGALLRRSRKPVVGAVVAAVALAGAGVAVAAGLGAFEGTPAPPEITNDFVVPQQIVDAATKQGFARAFPQADVSRAHGVIEIQTPDGPEDLWAAPNDQGGECYFIDFVNDPVTPTGHKQGSGGCSTAATSPIDVEGPGWSIDHPKLLTFNGIVSGSASTVRLTLQDGATLTLPVVEHFFLGTVAKPAESGDAKVAEVTAFDAEGNRVADWTPPQ